jgi:hypothetical protein
VLKIRAEGQPLPDDVAMPALDVPMPEQSRNEPQSSPFGEGLTIRAARGRFGGPGPGAIWFRADRPLVAGAPISQAMRGGSASTSATASSALDFQQWTFSTPTSPLTWRASQSANGFCSMPHTWIGPDGAGLAMARLADTTGYFGRCVQSLVIAKR